MKRHTFGAVLTLALMLGAGCATPPPATAPVAVAAATVTAKGNVGLRAPGYRLQAAVDAYTADDVDAIKVYLTKDGGTEQLMGEIAGCDATLVLGNLKMNSEYAVRLEAYTDLGEGDMMRIDADEACHTTFSTTNDDEITGLTFNLALADQTFRGTAAGGVTVEPGEVVEAEDAEDLVDLSGEPSPQPSEEPSEEPSVEPSAEPSAEPSDDPLPECDPADWYGPCGFYCVEYGICNP